MVIMSKIGLTVKCLVILGLSINAANAAFWQAEDISNRSDSSNSPTIQYFSNDQQGLRTFLSNVPQQHSGQSLEIELPMPDGSLTRFSIQESSIMAPELAATFPQIKSYKVLGIDDPAASGRVDMSPKGFRGMIYTSQGRVFIDPVIPNSSANRYLSRAGETTSADRKFHCGTHSLEGNQAFLQQLRFSTNNRTAPANRVPGSLIEYQLAVAATQEYVAAVGGTLMTAMSEINTAINRVNEIYNRDVGVQLILVGNNNLVIDVGGTSPLAGNNSDGFSLLGLNQTWVDAQIGTGSYDIGHVFSTGGGGVARLGSVCDVSAKAQGVTGLPNPTGDMFYIDFVAHEIGHQFGAEHTFNGTEGSCGPNRSTGGSVSFEPGSGSTIMSYAGICSTENIQLFSEATFHAGSIDQINSFVSGAGICGVPAVIAPANTEPTANAGQDFVIPKGTPFQLEGTGSDVDAGDTLTYQWDQMDAGTETDEDTLGQDLGDNALFRSYAPQASASRHLPALGTQVNNQKDLSETLPCLARDVNFRLTVRDGNSGQATDNVALTVDESAGPFKITSPNSAALISPGSVDVTWAVANTNNATTNCSNVDIDLLTFAANHSTYAVTPLETATPNDGTAAITIPDMANSNARFRVTCSNNIFYDISDADLTIQGTGGNFATTGNNTFFNSSGQTFAAKGEECTFDGLNSPLFDEEGGGSSGSTSPGWLYFLGFLMSTMFIRQRLLLRLKS